MVKSGKQRKHLKLSCDSFSFSWFGSRIDFLLCCTSFFFPFSGRNETARHPGKGNWKWEKCCWPRDVSGACITCLWRKLASPKEERQRRRFRPGETPKKTTSRAEILRFSYRGFASEVSFFSQNLKPGVCAARSPYSELKDVFLLLLLFRHACKRIGMYKWRKRTSVLTGYWWCVYAFCANFFHNAFSLFFTDFSLNRGTWQWFLFSRTQHVYCISCPFHLSDRFEKKWTFPHHDNEFTNKRGSFKYKSGE